MSRLPTPGSDAGAWGDILNEYLSQAHKADGTLKDGSVGSTQLQANAVTNGVIAPGAVSSASIAAGAVTSSALAINAVNSAILANGAVTSNSFNISGGTAGQVLTLDSAAPGGFTWSTPTVTSVNTRTGAVTGLAEASDLTAHAADTTGVHGIADTAALVLTSDARLSDARTPTAHTHPLADVTDAGTAAAADVGDFATAGQGAKADTAVQPADLAVYATNGGLYFPTPNAWLKWRARRAAVMAATTQGHIAVVGDSIAYGAAASGTTTPKYSTSWPGRLRALLAARYGSAGTGIVIADPVIRANPTYDNRWTYAGTITDLTFGFHAGANFRVDAVAATYLEFTATAEEFTVFNANAAGGVINATVDGGAIVKLRNVYSGGAAVNIEKQAGYKQIVTKVPAGAVGTHTLRLTPDTSNATFDLFIHAIEARINTPGTFRVSNASINSKSLSTLFGGAGKNDELNALYGLPMVDMLRADLLIIALGSNDWLSSTTAATAKAWLRTLIQRQRATGDNGNGSTYASGDALLVWNPQPDLTTLGLGTPSTWQDYRDMFYEVADEENVPLLDLGTRWNTYAVGNAAGFFGDGIHPNDAGSLDMAHAVLHALFVEA